MQIGTLPRIKFANLPTSLEEMPNLSKKLGGPRIFIKRDDETGLGFGGNKTRKLEYIMADAKNQKADTIITGAGFQSNWCTQTACAARKLGMKIILIKQGPTDGYDPLEYDGNHLLHVITGADVKVVTSQRNAHELTKKLAEGLRQRGHIPYIIPFAGSTPLGVAGYVNAILEILNQIIQKKLRIDYIIHPTGSGGTQSGLILGAKAYNTGIKVIGISVSQSQNRHERILNLVTNSAQIYNVDLALDKEDVIVLDEYVGEGYGIIDDEVMKAIQLVAKTEGIFLDPVYTGKAMKGLIDLIGQSYFNKDDNILFLHTGGSVALFPYKDPFKAFLKSDQSPWTRPSWSVSR